MRNVLVTNVTTRENVSIKLTRFILVDTDGSKYIDPFTSKTAIFESQNQALMISMMLFDQQQREFKVEVLK